MSNVRPEIESYLRKIINGEGEILFQSMNMQASLDSAKLIFFYICNFYAWFAEEYSLQKGKGNIQSLISYYVLGFGLEVGKFLRCHVMSS